MFLVSMDLAHDQGLWELDEAHQEPKAGHGQTVYGDSVGSGEELVVAEAMLLALRVDWEYFAMLADSGELAEAVPDAVRSGVQQE